MKLFFIYFTCLVLIPLYSVKAESPKHNKTLNFSKFDVEGSALPGLLLNVITEFETQKKIP